MMAKRTDSPPTTSHSAMALIETLERHLGPRAGPLAREGADSLDSEAMAAIIASRPVRGKQGSPVDGSRNRAPAWRASKGRPHTGFSRHKGLASLFSLVLRRIRNRWPPCEREPYPRCSTASPRHAGCRESALGPRQRRWAAPCGPSGARFDSRRPNLAVRDLHFRRRPARRRRDVLRRLPGATSSHPDGQARLLFRGPRRRQCLLPLAERIRRPVSIRRIRGDPRRERFPGSNRRPWTLSVDRRRLDRAERLPDHVARCRRRRRTERGRFVPHLGRRNPAALDQRLRIRSAMAGHLDCESLLDDRLDSRGLRHEYRYSRPTIFRHNAYLDFIGHRGENAEGRSWATCADFAVGSATLNILRRSEPYATPASAPSRSPTISKRCGRHSGATPCPLGPPTSGGTASSCRSSTNPPRSISDPASRRSVARETWPRPSASGTSG